MFYEALLVLLKKFNYFFIILINLLFIEKQFKQILQIQIIPQFQIYFIDESLYFYYYFICFLNIHFFLQNNFRWFYQNLYILNFHFILF